MRGYVIDLDDPPAATGPAAIGAKGHRLACLRRAGFPVPPGFVVGTAALRTVRAGGDGAGTGHDDGDDCGPPAMTEPIRDETLHAYRRLAASLPTGVPTAVAVRSSATAEDMARSSFAGGYDTFLNVHDELSVLDAVTRCWSSLHGERAAAALAQNAVDPATVDLAVVVQQMVPADSAGVLFTANPLTGDRAEAVINASWGLGRAVVDGLVTPDTVVVDKATGRVRHTVIGDKAAMTIPASTGTAEVEVNPDRRARPVLDPATIASLANLGRAVEELFGEPQDIEWALADGRLYLLQTRPVTGLPSGPSPTAGVPGDDIWPALGELPPQEFDLWTQVNVGEIWPCPLTPLVWSGVPFIVGTTTRYALRGLNSPLIPEVQWARRLYGRVYYNEGAFTRVCSQELGLPASLIDRAVGSRRAARHGGDHQVHPIRILRRLPFGLRFAIAQLWSGRRLATLVPQVDAWVDDFRRRDLDEIGDQELYARLDAWVHRFIAVMSVNTRVSVSAIVSFGLLERLAGRDGSRTIHDLMTGLPGMRSVDMGVALAAMARWLSGTGLAGVVLDHEPVAALRLLRDQPEAAPFLAMLEEFLRRHGHHCPNEGEWLYPRWADAPEEVIGMLAGYLRVDADPAGTIPGRGMDAGVDASRRLEALAAIRRGAHPARWMLFRFLLSRVQRLVLLRDAGKECYSKLLYPLRHGYAVLGQRWAARGWLDQADDVFFLTIPEVEQIVSAQDPAAAATAAAARVGGRRLAYEYWSGLEAPEVIGADHLPVPQPEPELGDPVPAEPASTSILEGLPVSSGRARGPVRVVLSAGEAGGLRPGDILVTRATDPGWTPLFPLVAGLVVEIGGQLSHTAIIAREYGLPVVANIRHATRRLRTGQIVTVDGTAGLIQLDDVSAATET